MSLWDLTTGGFPLGAASSPSPAGSGITISWDSRVINVPKSFLTLNGGSLYTLDLNAFRLALKDIEDEDGMPFPDTHRHNTTVTISGATYARVIEIINGYTVTFEDGQYAVILIGANSNVADVTNVNQVSVRPNNSAGLIVVTQGSGITAQDKIDIAALVTGDGKTLTVGKFLGLK